MYDSDDEKIDQVIEIDNVPDIQLKTGTGNTVTIKSTMEFGHRYSYILLDDTRYVIYNSHKHYTLPISKVTYTFPVSCYNYTVTCKIDDKEQCGVSLTETDKQKLEKLGLYYLG